MPRKVILITGAAKRVGKEIALYFAEREFDVAVHYNNSVEEAEELRSEVQNKGAKCEIFQHDLKEVAGTKNLIKTVKDKFGNIDILVNNASVFEETKFLETDEELFDLHFDVNFKAPFFLSQEFAKQIKKGSIYNIIDNKLNKTADLFFTYLLSKKVLAEFTKNAARILGPEIRVNGIAPGVLLPSLDKNEEQIKKDEQNFPLKKHATPEDVAQAIFFLEQQDKITGEIVKIDGGQHLL